MKNDATTKRTGSFRSVIPGSVVHLQGQTAAIPNPSARATVEPRIELVRDQDVVQAIDVFCTCGCQIRLQCVYS